jgi:malate dehydrogenase (oxaloacetate-decarboxylating)
VPRAGLTNHESCPLVATIARAGPSVTSGSPICELMRPTSASYSISIRLQLENRPGVLARVLTAIGDRGGNVGAVDLIRARKDRFTRDVTVETAGEEHAREISEALQGLDGVEVLSVADRTFMMHQGGKIEVRSKSPLRNRAQLSMAYTPGVARVCKVIAEDPEQAYGLTIKSNTVAIVSDGTAVLGLGDIGPEAAMPVMEGKAMLFKEFAGVDAFPLCLATKDTDEIVAIVKAVAPAFGGVNLEDISAPRCFDIERRLQEELDIPIFHDDQHGTAVVMIAALLNALKVVDKSPEDLRVVVAGVGAAGTACTDMMLALGVHQIIGCDRAGIVHTGRDDLNAAKRDYAERTNPEGLTGTIHDAMRGADVFVGLSGPDIITVDDLKAMADDPIVFAMSNPDPEIAPEAAYPHVAVMATGRSDYPNQINNVLCFPGLFRGALDCRASAITEGMKMAAAEAIAAVVPEEALAADYIVPSVFNKAVAPAVAEAVVTAARTDGVARR